jgi:2-octaprenyl-6-methoxyphenol hydroxylase
LGTTGLQMPETSDTGHQTMPAARVVVAGAGPVGACAALALEAEGIPVLLVDARAGPAARDDRTLALAYGSRLILERLQVWSHVRAATPILSIHVSQRGAFGRTRLTAKELGIPVLGYVCAYGDLSEAVDLAVAARHLRVVRGARVTGATVRPDAVAVQIEREGAASTCDAALLVRAEGSPADGPADHSSTLRDYGQFAVTADVRTDRPHAGIAYERFTPDGPIALLPKGDGFGIVWTLPVAIAERVRALDDDAFLAALGAAFGSRAGRFVHTSPRSAFPLRLQVHPDRGSPRTTRIGNAAQTLHPVAGQGFNLGLRDAFELARTVGTAAADPGASAPIAVFERQRQPDRSRAVRITDAMVRVFSHGDPAFSIARGIGLTALDVLPPLRRAFARQMTFGKRGEGPGPGGGVNSPGAGSE